MKRLILAAVLLAAPAFADEPADLREFRIGDTVQDLPRHGYVGLSCAAEPSRQLATWQEFGRCPADAAGLREVRFRYDEAGNERAGINDNYEGTRVGGHPVRLGLLMADDGRLVGIRIETDPEARLYLRKKAFLLGEQAKAHYGLEGWTCRDAEPQNDEAPVGGVFLRQHCEKTLPTRRIIVDRALYRCAGQALRDFINASQVLILGRGS